MTSKVGFKVKSKVTTKFLIENYMRDILKRKRRRNSHNLTSQNDYIIFYEYASLNDASFTYLTMNRGRVAMVGTLILRAYKKTISYN